jgi:methylase of polypeptide subunit release factors
LASAREWPELCEYRMKTIQELYDRGKDLIGGNSEAGLEARVLLCKSASVEEEAFFADKDRKVTRGEERKFLRLVSKRRSGVPLSYLTHEKEFWSLSFEVYRGVLIPRPESELIVEKVVELASPMNESESKGGETNESESKSGETNEGASERSKADEPESGSDKPNEPTSKRAKTNKPASKRTHTDKNDADFKNEDGPGIKNTLIADIGTGSGNIAISLARELPGAQIVATDVSKTALKMARMNARRLGASNVIFPQGSLFAPLDRFKLQGKCDFIVSNPPYVAQKDWDTLQPEIRNFEPKRALVAGKTGLEFIRKLAKGARKYLKPGGYLLFEIGYGQKDEVLCLLNTDQRWQSVQCFDDLNAIPRVVVAQI